MNPLFWFWFPFLCVGLVFVLVGITRLVRWVRHRLDWMDHVRTQRTVWEEEELQLLRGMSDEE